MIGDSHAAAQWQGLARAFPQVHFLQMSRASCRPDPARTEGDCGVLNQLVFADFLLSHHVDRIIAVGRWLPSDIPAVDRTVAWTKAHGIPMTLIGPTQDYDAPLPRLLAYGFMRHDPALAERHRIAGTRELDSRFARLAEGRWHVPYISPVRMFCPDAPGGAACQTHVDSGQAIPLLIDGDHLSNEGSVLAGQRIARQHLWPDGTARAAQLLDRGELEAPDGRLPETVTPR